MGCTRRRRLLFTKYHHSQPIVCREPAVVVRTDRGVIVTILCKNVRDASTELYRTDKHTHTHTRLTALFPELPGWAGTRKVKPIWILLEQETVSGSGISWAICKSVPRSRQTTTPAPHHSVFTGRVPFLPPNQQRQSTEGNTYIHILFKQSRANIK